MTRNSSRTSFGLKPRSYRPRTSRSFQACRPAGSPCVCRAFRWASTTWANGLTLASSIGLVRREVQQLHRREPEAGLAAEQAAAEVRRPPGGIVVGQHGEAGHRPIVPVEDAIIVDVHAPRELRVARRLHFDVDQHPALGAVRRPDLDELIDVTPADLGLAHHLLELLVQRLVAARPVDLPVDLREQQRQERLEVSVQRFLPRAVVVGGHRRLPGSVALSYRQGVRLFQLLDLDLAELDLTNARPFLRR